MLPIQKILVPVDFSSRCLKMSVYAGEIAAKYNAELTLLHVVNPMYNFPPTAISGPVMIPVAASTIAEREQQLDQFAVEELRGARVRRLVYEGDPAEQIVECVNSEDVQLLVMATHGHGPLRRFLIGSVTAKILHDTACAVLTGVHIDPQHVVVSHFGKLLCAIDGGSHGEVALAWTAQLAADFGAQLDIVHVVAHEEDASQAMVDVKRLQEATGTATCAVHIQEGEPAATACSLAQTLGSDLLVIGRGDKTGEGSLTDTAYSIIRESPCPVISIR